jgi:hypothetical protein
LTQRTGEALNMGKVQQPVELGGHELVTSTLLFLARYKLRTPTWSGGLGGKRNACHSGGDGMATARVCAGCLISYVGLAAP